MTDRLAQHVEDPVTDERLERIWQNVQSRRDEYQPSRSRKHAAVIIGSLAVAAGVAMGWLFGVPLHDEPTRAATGPQTGALPAAPAGHFEVGAALRTAGEKMAIDLEDGSKVTLDPRSRVAMRETESDDVALELQQGRVVCSVAKRKHRTFAVLAGDVTVRVLGTQFAVQRVPLDARERVSVEVTEGIVQVEGPDGVLKRLAAGESWSVKLDRKGASATDADGPQPTPAATQPPSRAEEKPAEARDLFAEARQARNSGNAREAAQLYQRFLSQSGEDPRSGLAALELGRLKMDELGDVRGAIAPLSRAANSVGGGLGDDALARLVRAHASLGQTSACRSARARYLKAYSKGVHVQRVRATCP